MTLSRESLLQKLTALAASAEAPQRYLIAFSGGLDSTVLLHMLAGSASDHGVELMAVHVDHGLQRDSDHWAQRCEAVAADLGVETHIARVSVDLASGGGPEAAAREARYQALASFMRPGDWLLSAHHQDDQAETLLLNLVRGAGPAGLAGIGEIRSFASGWLARPMLSFSRKELQDYAGAEHLSWIEDPSNSDQALDRNFLRHEILPRLASRWPEAARCLKRSSDLAAEAALLLDHIAAMDAAAATSEPGRHDQLSIDALKSLPTARQRNVLRFTVRQCGLPTPSAAQVQQVLDTVLTARDDAGPVVRWSGAEIRRYRNRLFVLPAGVAEYSIATGHIVNDQLWQLGHGLGVLRLEADAPEGLSKDVVARGLELRFRSGGEEFRPLGQRHTKKLKKLLQESGVLPWMRDRVPLLFSGGQLVAVADLWLAADAASKPGSAVHWENRPSIH